VSWPGHVEFPERTRVTVKVTPWHPVGAEEESSTKPAMDSVPLMLLALTLSAGETAYGSDGTMLMLALGQSAVSFETTEALMTESATTPKSLVFVSVK
jgi:hypothetical protein